MYLADTTVLSKSKYPYFYDYMDSMSRLSKCLYNAALFRIRQIFTGWDKEERTDNEKEILGEVRVMQAAYPHVGHRAAAGADVPRVEGTDEDDADVVERIH